MLKLIVCNILLLVFINTLFYKGFCIFSINFFLKLIKMYTIKTNAHIYSQIFFYIDYPEFFVCLLYKKVAPRLRTTNHPFLFS